MAKVKQPLFSLDARRKLGDEIVYGHRQKANIVETRPRPKDARSVGQLSWRHMFLKVVALWHALSAAEKEAWESLARPRHMTGYAWFVSQALKPNPGIYLPLQGGTMTGEIDMGADKIVNLLDPTNPQDAVTLAYYLANLPVGGYTEGASVYHNVDQAIPAGVYTALAFNAERWDTDGIHSNTVNNSRLTCKTAGKYITLYHYRWEPSAVGARIANLKMNTGVVEQVSEFPIGFANRCDVFGVCEVDLNINDFLEVFAFQNSGGALDIDALARFSPEFKMQRIGA